jgi:hypothetical protein
VERERLWGSSGHGWRGLVLLAEFVEPVRELAVAADCPEPTLGGFATGSVPNSSFGPPHARRTSRAACTT